MSDCEPFDSRDLIPRIERLEKIASILAVSRYNKYNKTSCKDINEVKQHSFVNESLVDDFISAVLSEVKTPKRSVVHPANLSCLVNKSDAENRESHDHSKESTTTPHTPEDLTGLLTNQKVVCESALREVQCTTCDSWFFTADQKNKCKHCSKN